MIIIYQRMRPVDAKHAIQHQLVGAMAQFQHGVAADPEVTLQALVGCAFKLDAGYFQLLRRHDDGFSVRRQPRVAIHSKFVISLICTGQARSELVVRII